MNIVKIASKYGLLLGFVAFVCTILSFVFYVLPQPSRAADPFPANIADNRIGSLLDDRISAKSPM